MNIREFRPDDTDALYEICLRTVDAGNDGTLLYPTYPELPGHLALGANLTLEPQFAFVLQDGTGAPIGYVVGAADTRAFYKQCEQLWWPPLRERYPDPVDVPPEHHTPEQRLLHAIHQPILAPDAVLDAYPSHLHINLMPPAQGRGFGKLLLDTLFAALRDAGSTGIFLGVPPANTRAIGFYHRMGFQEIPNLAPHSSLRLGRAFPSADAADA
jgi:ribosomal protein S18 acetylase RimI-like enzyme